MTAPIVGLAPFRWAPLITTNASPTLNKHNRYDTSVGAAALSVTLPSLTGPNVGANMIIEKYTLDATNNTVTFTCAGLDTFDDGSTTKVLAKAGDALVLQIEETSVGGPRKWAITGRNSGVLASGGTILALDSNGNITVDNTFRGYNSFATAGAITPLTVNDVYIQELTGVTTQTVKLPTTSIPAGAQYLIINSSTGAVTVQSSGANTITILAAGTAGLFTARIATPTTAANWDGRVYLSLSDPAVSLAAAQILTNKTVSDTFMGKAFDTSKAQRDTVLLASTDFVVNDVIEVPAANTLEVPGTSTLEVVPAFTRAMTGRKRVVMIPNSATPTIDAAKTDVAILYNFQQNVTAVTVINTHLMEHDQPLILEWHDVGTPLTIAHGSQFLNDAGTMITATLAGKTHREGFMWDQYRGLLITEFASATGY